MAGAEQNSVSRFRHLCHHLRHAADPVGVALGERDMVSARSVRFSNDDDGMVFVRVLLDPVGGAAFRGALEPLAKKCGKDDERPYERRLGDAVVEYSTLLLDSGRLPQKGGMRPHLLVTTTLETLLGQAGAPAAELEYSLPISARAVERIACDCTVTRILLGADSAVIDVGRAKRVIPPSTRRAVHARDGCCRWPGCTRSISATTPHHYKHWIRGGPTAPDNLLSFCSRHHWMLHEGGWEIIWTDDDRIITLPPNNHLWDLYPLRDPVTSP